MSEILTRLAAKDAAAELRKAVIETMKDQVPPRTSLKIGVLDALEPLIIAISELQAAQQANEPNVQIEGLRAFAQSRSNAGLGLMRDCKPIDGSLKSDAKLKPF